MEKIIESFQKVLADCVSSIRSSGLNNLNAQLIDKLDNLSHSASELGMTQGKKLIENLSTVLKTFKEGKSGEDSVMLRIEALDFYLKNTNGAATEEL